MHNRLLAAAAALAFSAAAAVAGPLVKAELAPVQHVEATLVVVGTDGSETVYAPADLETLPTYSMTTITPWRDEPAEFEGVLLNDILAANGLADIDAIMVTAENDYRTVIEREVWETVDILVATRVNGEPHNRRERGPIQFMIDWDAFNASSVTTESNLVWMAARIEPAN